MSNKTIRELSEALVTAGRFIKPIAEWERKNGCIIPDFANSEEVVEVIYNNGIKCGDTSRYAMSVMEKALSTNAEAIREAKE